MRYEESKSIGEIYITREFEGTPEEIVKLINSLHGEKKIQNDENPLSERVIQLVDLANMKAISPQCFDREIREAFDHFQKEYEAKFK